MCALGVIAIFHSFTWSYLDKVQKAFCSKLPHTYTDYLIWNNCDETFSLRFYAIRSLFSGDICIFALCLQTLKVLWNYAVNPNRESEWKKDVFTQKPATFFFLKVTQWQQELFQYWKAEINCFHHTWWIRYTVGWVLISKIIISDLLYKTTIVYFDRNIDYMTIFLNFHNTDISCQTVNQK